LAKQKGATSAQVASIFAFESGPFAEREKLGFRLTDRVHRAAAEIDDDFFALLRTAYTDRQIIELTAVAAAYEFFTRFVDALRIPTTPLPEKPETS
jgi:alkylhydroperoxidase family enzyme